MATVFRLEDMPMMAYSNAAVTDENSRPRGGFEPGKMMWDPHWISPGRSRFPRDEMKRDHQTIDVAVLGAVPTEIEPLFPLLENARSIHVAGATFWVGHCFGHLVLAGAGGMGKVNAAVTTAALLQGLRVLEVWNIGSAGAYAESPLAVGDVLISDTVWCGDEGILTRNCVRSTREIGIPMVKLEDREYYDAIPLHTQPIMEKIRGWTPAGSYKLHTDSLDNRRGLFPGDPALERPPAQGTKVNSFVTFRVFYGPSLTVGMVSGDADTAQERSLRFGAYAENMEGSAVVQACMRFGVPVLECRGISNRAGDRSRDRWRMEKALSHCHAVVRRWLNRGHS